MNKYVPKTLVAVLKTFKQTIPIVQINSVHTTPPPPNFFFVF